MEAWFGSFHKFLTKFNKVFFVRQRAEGGDLNNHLTIRDEPRQCIKKQRNLFANKGPSSQGYGFSSSHVWRVGP